MEVEVGDGKLGYQEAKIRGGDENNNGDTLKRVAGPVYCSGEGA